MITALRIFAWLLLVVGAVSTIGSLMAFFIEISGLFAKSTDDKTLLLFKSCALLLASVLILLGARPVILQRTKLVWRASMWLEHLPVDNNQGRRIVFWIVVAFSIIGVVAVPDLKPMDRALALIGMPFGYGIGFVSAVIVLGAQIFNPLCPETALRFATLLFLSASALMTVFGLPAMFFMSDSDPATILVPVIGLGTFAGSAYILRRWTNFKPLDQLVAQQANN